MNSNNNVVAVFKDKYGEERRIHNTRSGLKVERKNSTLSLHLNKIAGVLVGQKIKALRLQKGLTLEELCMKSGIVSATPKSRMWEIENSLRKEGIRLGTLFALSISLGVEPHELLPTTREVMEHADIKVQNVSILRK